MRLKWLAWRRFSARLALMGLALLLLQPVCDTFGLHVGAAQANAAAPLQHGGGSDSACCTELKAAGLVAAGEALADAGKPLALAVALLLLAFVAPPSRVLSRVAASARPAPQLSYYARTARILR